MPEAASRGTRPEKFESFDQSKFAADDKISYYQDGSWHFGVLDGPPEIRGSEVSMSVGGAGVESKIPPRKLEVPTISSLSVDGVEYTFDPLYTDDDNLDEEGNLVYDLESTDANPADKKLIQRVPAELIVATERGLDTAEKINDAIAEVASISDFKKKDLLKDQSLLQQKVRQILDTIGSARDWGEIERTDLEDVVERVRVLEREISGEGDTKGELQLLKDKIEFLNKATGSQDKAGESSNLQASLSADIAKKQGDAQTSFEKQTKTWEAWQKYNKEKREWDHAKTVYDEAKTAAAAGGDDKKIPDEPGVEPQKPKGRKITKEPIRDDDRSIEVDEKMNFFDSMADGDELKAEVVTERKNNFAKTRSGTGDDFPPGSNGDPRNEELRARFREETVKAVDAVFLKRQKLSVDEIESKFIFQDEVRDLERKIAFFKRTLPDNLIEKEKKYFRDLLDEVGELRENDTDIREQVLDIWKRFRAKEVEIYEKTLEGKRPTRELKKRDIDVPQDLLHDILSDRKGEVQRVMESLYTDSILQRSEDGDIIGKDTMAEAKIKGALKGLFDKAPDLYIQKKLKNYGIKDWDHFKLLLDGRLGDQLSLSLNELAQTQLNIGMAKKTARKEVSILKKVTGLWSKIRGKGDNRFQGEWNKEERQQFIRDTIHDNFANDSTFDDKTSVMFSAVVAQALRELTAEGADTKDADEIAVLKNLDANAKRIYREAIRRLEFEGENVSLEQRRDIILLLFDLQTGTEMQVAEKLKGVDPRLTRMVAGSLDFYTTGGAESRSSATPGVGKLPMRDKEEFLRRGEERGLLEVGNNIKELKDLLTAASWHINDRQRGRLDRLASKFKRALISESVDNASADWFVYAIHNDPMIKKQVENYVYEADMLEIKRERNAAKDLSLLMTELDGRKKDVNREVQQNIPSAVKKVFKKVGWKIPTAAVTAIAITAVVAFGTMSGDKDVEKKMTMEEVSERLDQAPDSPDETDSELGVPADENVAELEDEAGLVPTGEYVDLPNVEPVYDSEGDVEEPRSTRGTTDEEIQEMEDGDDEDPEVKVLKNSIKTEKVKKAKSKKKAETPKVEASKQQKKSKAEGKVTSSQEETDYSSRVVKNNALEAEPFDEEGSFLKTVLLDNDEKFSVIFDEDGTKIGYVGDDGVAHEGVPKGWWPLGIPETMQVPGGIAETGSEVASEIIDTDDVEKIDLREIVDVPENKEVFLWLNSAANGQISDVEPGQQLAAVNLKNQFNLAHSQGNSEEVSRLLEEMKTLKDKADQEIEAETLPDKAEEKDGITRIKTEGGVIIDCSETEDGSLFVKMLSRGQMLSDRDLFKEFFGDKSPEKLYHSPFAVDNMRTLHAYAEAYKVAVKQGGVDSDASKALLGHMKSMTRKIDGYTPDSIKDFLEPDFAQKLGL
ncbi:MAG: hypothetical protein HOA57_03675 [Candidatus Magasanikbacteria bacterium]|jgi:hypothetical protein|nr:hypothetical protein [Candidatus Magasanikbacteria bacterium]MBT4314571.1 hypothetical protein [Candidatus Magasanikbacteria bacterium]MBT4547469.1 hypothetical protein [Candidatus Magasanikbacteria bacterium]MBT6819451.1 hypothetical protein [Candidatus Magasanikbacteria bacterium]